MVATIVLLVVGNKTQCTLSGLFSRFNVVAAVVAAVVHLAHLSSKGAADLQWLHSIRCA